MTYITKNDYRHANTRKGYATADAAAHDFQAKPQAKPYHRENPMGQLIGEHIYLLHLLHRLDRISSTLSA